MVKKKKLLTVIKYSGYNSCFLHVLAVKRELEAEAAALAEKEKAAAAEVSVA